MCIQFQASLGGSQDDLLVTPAPEVDDAQECPVAENVSKARGKPRRRRMRTPPKGEFRFYVDRQGRQHFNFEQQVWLDESVPMAYTAIYSIALKTLALNILTLSLNRHDVPLAVGRTCRTALVLAATFGKQCLLGAPPKAWILPKSTIRAWLKSKRREGRLR